MRSIEKSDAIIGIVSSTIFLFTRYPRDTVIHICICREDQIATFFIDRLRGDLLLVDIAIFIVDICIELLGIDLSSIPSESPFCEIFLAILLKYSSSIGDMLFYDILLFKRVRFYIFPYDSKYKLILRDHTFERIGEETLFVSNKLKEFCSKIYISKKKFERKI